MRKKSKSSFGFSLIELLIVVSIIILFSGFSFAAYNTFNEERILDDEAKKFISVLNLAQTKSSSSEDAACSLFQGYTVAITGSQTYTLRRCCNGVCTNNAQTTAIQAYNLSSNDTFSPTSYVVHYKVLSRGIARTVTSPITIRNSKIGKCIDIDIQSSGVAVQSEKESC